MSIDTTTKTRNNLNTMYESCIGYKERQLDLFKETPLIRSHRISSIIGYDVYFKLDCYQNSGSFKDRGMSYLCSTILQQQQQQQKVNDNDTTSTGSSTTTEIDSKKINLISSSGGNAGLAVAIIGKKLNMNVTVIVPETTKTNVILKLQSFNATVQVHGKQWNDADTLARSIVTNDRTNNSYYISPYDNPLLWTGHSTLIDEIYIQLQLLNAADDQKQLEPIIEPSCIIASVGGGGLLCGIYEGLDRIYNSNNNNNKQQEQQEQQRQQKQKYTKLPIVIGAETIGTNCFALSYKSNTIQSLQSITSIATSLGALQVTAEVLKRCTNYDTIDSDTDTNIETNNDNKNTVPVMKRTLSSVCSDADAVDACVQFYQDHNILVEPACGAALAVVYNEKIRNELLVPNILKHISTCSSGPIIVEVCGGSGVTNELLQQWKEQFNIL